MNIIVPPSLFRRNGGGGVNTFENRMIGQLRTDLEANKNVATDDWMYFNEPVIQSILDAGRLCQYCGLQLDEYTVSFDRIDNDNCHTASNVILTCAPCNITRSNQFFSSRWRSSSLHVRTFASSENKLLSPSQKLSHCDQWCRTVKISRTLWRKHRSKFTPSILIKWPHGWYVLWAMKSQRWNLE